MSKRLDMLRQRFDNAVAELNSIREAAEKLGHDANYYLSDDQLHLMDGPSHDDDDKARQDRSLHSAWLVKSGGGGW